MARNSSERSQEADAPIPEGVRLASLETTSAGRELRQRAAAVNLVLLVGLTLVWGGSFALIKIGVRDLAPATLVTGRLAFAALALAVAVPVALGPRTTASALRTSWRPLVVVGLVNTALPFWLLSWGETRIDSGLASIVQASVPIFVALIAFAFFHEQRVTGARLVGVVVGFAGVALLVGARPQGEMLGALAVVGMAACYATGGLLARRHLAGARAEIVALGTIATALVATLPAGLAQAHTPSWSAIAAVAILGVVGTAFAYLLYFTLIARAGASYASLTTYLVPPIALAYGALALGESLDAGAYGGLALILGGVALGTGALRPRRVR